MPEAMLALLALLAVSWGVNKLHRHTKSRTKKRRSSFRIFSAHITRKLMEIVPSVPAFSLGMIRFSE
jgi:hypothetical protein